MTMRHLNRHPLRIFSGSAHPALAHEIAGVLDVHVGHTKTTCFPDTETHVMIEDVVRDHDIFFLQSCGAPVNENLMELLLYVDAFRRASAHEITAVIPYFPYGRQERMSRGREAISARVVANMLETLGTSRVMFVDIHARAIQGFFNIPTDPLSALPLLAKYFKREEFSNAAIVSPDVGRANLAGRYAEYLNLPLVVMHKRREGNKTEATHVVGDIKGRRPIIIDDVIASGSVLKQIDVLYDKGAEGGAYFCITHPVLLPSALEILDRDNRIEKLVVTNTLPVPPEKHHSKLEIISVAPLLADIIQRVHDGVSISERLKMASY
ncbi:MAG: ribose-phosphate diphosphokinase [Chloroflexota bacterium]